MTTQSLISTFHNILNDIYVDISKDDYNAACMRIGAAMANLEILSHQPEISGQSKEKLISTLKMRSFLIEEPIEKEKKDGS